MISIFKAGSRKELAISGLWMTAIVLMTLILNLSWNPRFYPFWNPRFLKGLGPDSSVFAYAGKLVTEGELPYRDFWDHKPPAIYYVDSLAIRLMGVTPWAFWWLDFFWVALTTIMLFCILRKLAGTLAAIPASAVFLFTLMHPGIYSAGNLTEMFGLLPQVLIVAAAFLYFSSGHARWLAVLGLLTAAAFLFKQTCIGLGCGAASAILIRDLKMRQFRRSLLHLLWFSVGVVLPLGLIALIWAASGALNELVDAVLTYNFIYAGSGISMQTFSRMFQILLVEFPLMPLSIATLAALVVFIAKNRSRLFSRPQAFQDRPSPDPIPAKQWTLLAVFLALPFELAFLAMAGRNLMHYYMTILPVFAAAIAYLVQTLAAPLFAGRKLKAMEIVILILLTALGTVWFSRAYTADKSAVGVRLNLAQPLHGPLPLTDTERFILENSRPDESVLVWQVGKQLNLLTGRRNPSRYLYPLPLFLPNRGPESRFEQFLQDLRKDPPALIIGPKSPSPSLPFITSPDDQLCPGCIPEAMDGMRQLKAFVNEHYALISEDTYFVFYKYTR